MLKKAFGVFTVLILSACGAPQKSSVLRVGMELAYPPFETKNDNGEPVGISVDIAKAFAAYLKKDIVIENIAWTGLIPSLQTSKVDMVISSMTITEDRKNTVDFSEPYAQAYLAAFIGEKSSVSNAEDLNQKGRVLALKQGTTSHIYAQKYLTNATVNTFSSETAALTEVLQGKADAFLYDQLTIYRNTLEHPEARMVPLPETEESTGQWGVAFKKGNDDLRVQFNKFLDEFKSSGGFEELTKEYLSTEKEAFDKNGFKFFF